MIQTFGSHRFHPALRDGDGLGRPERRADGSDAERFRPLLKRRCIASVTIVDETARRFTIATARLDDLPSRPPACRMAGVPIKNYIRTLRWCSPASSGMLAMRPTL